MSDELAQPRAGSPSDLARRMDRIEQRHETLEAEVRTLAATIGRVEQNQNHATELNKLRFDSLDSGVKGVGTQLTEFIKRIEGIMSGEVETTAARQGREMVEDYREWRKSVDERLPDANEVAEYREWRRNIEVQTSQFAAFMVQGKLLGRLALILVGGNALAIIIAIGALIQK